MELRQFVRAALLWFGPVLAGLVRFVEKAVVVDD